MLKVVTAVVFSALLSSAAFAGQFGTIASLNYPKSEYPEATAASVAVNEAIRKSVHVEEGVNACLITDNSGTVCVLKQNLNAGGPAQ